MPTFVTEPATRTVESAGLELREVLPAAPQLERQVAPTAM